MYTPTTDNLQLVARAAPSLSMFKEGLGTLFCPIEALKPGPDIYPPGGGLIGTWITAALYGVACAQVSMNRVQT